MSMEKNKLEQRLLKALEDHGQWLVPVVFGVVFIVGLAVYLLQAWATGAWDG